MVRRNRDFGCHSLALLGATFLIAAIVGQGAVSSAGAEEQTNDPLYDTRFQGPPQQNRVVLPDVSLPVIKRKAKAETANKKTSEKDGRKAEKKAKDKAEKKARKEAADTAAKKAEKKAADKAKRKAARKAAKTTAARKKKEELSRQRAAARAAAKKRAAAQAAESRAAEAEEKTDKRTEARKRAAEKNRAEARKRAAEKKRAEARARRKAARKEAQRKARQAAIEKKYDAWDAEVTGDENARRLPVPRRKPTYQSHSLPNYRVPPPPDYRRRPRTATSGAYLSERQIEEALVAPPRGRFNRRYSLDRVMRDYRLRSRLRRIDINTINFRYDDAEVPPGQVYKLRKLGRVLRRIIARRPWEVFLIEGHTDLPGRTDYNLDLSEERAGSVKWILVDGFDIPSRNLVIRGYGEQFPVVSTDGPERLNRRVSVRRITPLLRRGEGPRRFRPYRRYGRPYLRPYPPYRRPY